MIRESQRQTDFYLRGIVMLSAVLFLFSCGGSGSGSAPLSTGVADAAETTSTNPGTGTSTASGIGIGLGYGFDISGSGIGRGAKFDISGSGIIKSRIDRFGSIIINGREYNTGSASFNNDGNQLATQADFKIDNVITLEANFDELTAVQVDYRSSIKAPVDSIVILAGGEQAIISLGQTIRGDVSTNFESSSFDKLLPGDPIEVSGVRNGAGDIIASLVERKPVLANYKLTGTITNMTADSFNIGSLIVNYAAASLMNFPNGVPEDGQFVQVTAAPADYSRPDNLGASMVEFFSPSIGSAGDSVELEGFVTSFTSVTEFEVSGIPVTTLGSYTAYLNGTSESLESGIKLVVNGSLNANGVLEADGIIVLPNSAMSVEGNIDAIDLVANTISVLGVKYEVRSATRLKDKSDADIKKMSLTDFTVGDRIKLSAYLEASGLVATRIEREDPDDDVSLQGLVNREDESAGTLRILGVLITPDTNITKFEDKDDNSVSQAEFHTLLEPGSIVKATWDVFAGTELAPDSLQIR